MSTITLHSTSDINSTIIPNAFIDLYMPSASGSYVKVYLLLLRCLQKNDSEFSLSYLAEKLDETEKDMLRALNYWEKEGLILITRVNKTTIESITVNTVVSDHKITVDKKVPTPTNSLTKDITIHKPNYSEAQIKVLTEMEEVKWIMNTVERLLERLLKPSDIQLILFIYESLGFSADLIFYLYDYCISKNKKSTSYIETVAVSWAQEGIDTVEKAEISTAAYNNNYNAVNKAFGLNRAPAAIEKKYMHRWFQEFKFEITIIEEACNRTMLATGKPDFKYADAILENWNKKGVSSLKDIALLDETHAKQAAVLVSNKQTAAAKQVATNKFNAFPQREYSNEDFISLEQRLLNNRS